MNAVFKGGASYTPSLASVIRYMGLVVPIILVAYGIFTQIDTAVAPRTMSPIGFSLLSFCWMFIAIWQFIKPSRTAISSALRLVAFHILAGIYLLYVTGVPSPLVALWILLLIASNIYFSQTGLSASILWFVLIVAIDIARSYQVDMLQVIYDLSTLVAVLLSGIVTLTISRSHDTAHRALHHSRRQENFQRDRIDTIINNITNAIVTTDKHGVIQLFNAATLNLLDTNGNLAGQPIDNVLPLVDKEKNHITFTEQLLASTTTVTRDDLFYAFSDGEEIRLEIVYSPIRSNYSSARNAEQHEGYMVILRDITKAKSLEEERDEFISVVSHELRTPITIMEGTLSNLQVMLGRKIEVPKASFTQAVTIAHDQSMYLAKMVNDLSTLSRAQRGVADEGEDIDVKDLMQKLHTEYTKDASAKKLHLNLDLGHSLGMVHASRLYLEELLQNFITNAIKYTKEGSIVISASSQGRKVTFTVKDTGIGISRTDQAKIFQKFYRSEDYRIRETNGTGLGLYVSEKLAHKLGTKIVMTSRLNHGSTFSFTLPSAHSRK